MPRYLVTEERAYKEVVLIDAIDEDAASKLDGDIIDEASTDSWGEKLLSIEQVDPNHEDATIE